MMISLYRGELHKVSGVPRQWPLPKPSISLLAFKQALGKRHAALLRCNVNLSSSLPSACMTDEGTSSLTLSRNVVSTSNELVEAEVDELDGKRDGEERKAENGCKVEYMDEDVVCEGNAVEPSQEAKEVQEGSPSEAAIAKLSLPNQGRDAIMQGPHDSKHLRGHHGFGEPEREPEERSGDTEKRETKKRKREEGVVGQGEKSIANSETFSGVPIADTSKPSSEPMALDGEEHPEEMDLDQKISEGVAVDAEMPQPPCGAFDFVREYKETVRRADEASGDGAGSSAETDAAGLRESCELQKERETEVLKVEAPSTPPANSGEKNSTKHVEDCSSAEKITETPAEPVADRKATKREELEAKLKKLTAEKHRLVQMLKQVLSSEEESKRKAQGLLPSPPALGNPNGVQVVTGGTNLTSAAVTSQENHNPGAADIHVSTDLEEGELDFARTPSPPVQTTPASHSSGHGVHPSLGWSCSRGILHTGNGHSSKCSGSSSCCREFCFSSSSFFVKLTTSFGRSPIST
ncbi:hypothetical protein BDL97_04G072800 [Sphagnum fallax]|nr:hypothetical protein BDL97_04G072800 [Sphagnum fallax]